MERTCTRWRNLLRTSWTRFKKLDFSEQKWGMKPLYKVDSGLVSIDLKHAIILKSVIEKCGSYLISLDLGCEKLSPCGKSVRTDVCKKSCILRIITKSCTKLQNIKIRVCCTNGLKRFAKHSNGLKSIKFFGLGYFYEKTIDEFMNSLVTNNSELKSMKLIKLSSWDFLSNTDNKFESLKLSLDSTHVNDSQNILAKCIERSQEILKELTIQAFNLNFDRILNALQHCVHLTKLKIHVELLVKNYSDAQFANIFKYCRFIESISVKGLYCDSENDYSDYFSGSETVHWLYHVNPVVLKKLHLEANSIATKNIFLNELPVFLNLRDLSLNNISTHHDTKICDSIATCINLQKLQFSRCGSLMKSTHGHYFFTYLTNLRDLTVIQYNNCNLNENEMVHCLAKNLKLLENLTLGLLNLSDVGLVYLPLLKNLRFLAILGNEKLVGTNLLLLKNLTCLKCLDCYKLSNNSLTLLIKNSVNLNKLIIERCTQITHKVIDAAIVVKSFAENENLPLTIEGNIYDRAIMNYAHKYRGLKLNVSYFDDMMYELENY